MRSALAGRRVVQAEHDIVAVDVDGVAAHLQPGRGRRLAGRYLEVPFVPGTAHVGPFVHQHDAVADRHDGADYLAATAQRRPAMWTAIGQCIEGAADVEQAHRPSADLHDAEGAGGWGLLSR